MTEREKNVNYNLHLKEELGVDWRGWAFHRCMKFVCVACGAIVSPAVLRFFEYDVTKILCYKCQEKKPLTKNL